MDPQSRAIYYTLYGMDPQKAYYLLRSVQDGSPKTINLLHFVQDGSSKNKLLITLCTGWILNNGLFITLCTGWILKKQNMYYTLYRMDPKKTDYLLHFVQDGSSIRSHFGSSHFGSSFLVSQQTCSLVASRVMKPRVLF